MKTFNTKVAAICSFLALAILPVQNVSAQWIVNDPLNFVENLLTEINTLKSTVNEMDMIANQMTSLANEAKNLQTMPNGLASSLLSQYTGLYTQLGNDFTTTNGLATNIANLVSQYNTMFPDRQGMIGTLTDSQVLAQVQNFLAQSRRTTQGAYQTSGRVMANLPQAQNQIANILSQSQASSGSLDATQAGTQMQGQIATQLVQMNAQIAALNQVQADMIAQQNAERDTAAKRSADLSSDLTNVGTRVNASYLPTLH